MRKKRQLSLKLVQKNKKYTCKGCGEIFTGHKRIFCNRQCLERHKQKELKMDFQDGHRHETPYPIEDYGIPTVSIPTNVLQEAKIYVDLHNPRIVEDARKVIRIAFRELYSLKKSIQKEK